MSKTKTESKHTVIVQQTKTPKKINTARMKKKKWMANRFKKKTILPKEKEKAKPLQTLPPTDAKQFSANWKALQEVCQYITNN